MTDFYIRELAQLTIISNEDGCVVYNGLHWHDDENAFMSMYTEAARRMKFAFPMDDHDIYIDADADFHELCDIHGFTIIFAGTVELSIHKEEIEILTME
jgi:lysylphosphatidylglycerol synthetase-like protein (DUF2156 family)